MHRFFLIMIVAACVSCSKPSDEQITTLACYDGQPKMSPDGKTIAYVTTQVGDRHIWMYDRESKITMPVTFNEGVDEGPAFSPDGERLIFSSRINGQKDLWILAVNDDLIQVTKTDSADEYDPFWSEDKVLFVRKTSGLYELCSMDSKNFSSVTIIYKDSVLLRTPSFAGKDIYFQRGSDQGAAIWFIQNADPVRWGSGRPMRDPAVSPDGQWLAFVSDTNGFSQVLVSPLSTFDPRLITTEKIHHSHPAWSQDGKSLLYEATPGWDIKIIDAKTQKEERIISDPSDDEAPVWSPDGKAVYFVSNRLGQKDIWRYDIDKKESAAIGPGMEPDISPDGNEILFTGDYGNRKTLYTRKLTSKVPGTFSYMHPASYQGRFSHDGKQIVFVSDSNGDPNIWLFDLKTRKQKQLTIDPRTERHPEFSRDDKEILFEANWAGRWSIWSVPVGGGLPKPWTRDKTPYGVDGEPALSPEGTLLALSRSWYDDSDIWLMSVTGGEKTTRTLSKDNTNQEQSGRWSPDGKSVVFQVGHNTDIWLKDVSDRVK